MVHAADGCSPDKRAGMSLMPARLARIEHASVDDWLLKSLLSADAAPVAAAARRAALAAP
jgi:hypothetical protein